MAGSTEISLPPAEGSVADSEIYELDPLTNLPLVPCPKCGDVKMVAFTVTNKESKNVGRRFFKCPRNRYKGKSSCSEYYFQDDYERLLLGRKLKTAKSNGDQSEVSRLRSHDDSGGEVGRGQKAPELGGAIRAEERGAKTCSEALFWLKVLCLQGALMILLMIVMLIVAVRK